ncbi:hypothetical protein [Anaerobiospirillum thomasii]|uniref:hypothetical protein n=1 Tax=Anaerobiospirillum thomasii TaxID=179995 RepID=UPI000DE5AE80|nr:hypothetical protein [Anaerobiospirillum thomasii]
MLNELYRYISNNSSDTPSADKVNTIYVLLSNRSCQRVIEGPFVSHNSFKALLPPITIICTAQDI